MASNVVLSQVEYRVVGKRLARPDGVDIHVAHDQAQRNLIVGYCNVYGTSNSGLGNIFGMGKNVRSFYRRIEEAAPVVGRDQAEGRLSSGAT